MPDMTIAAFSSGVSAFAASGQPFFFLVDFEMKKPVLVKLADAAGEGIFYSFHGKGNTNLSGSNHPPTLQSIPPDEAMFRTRFETVQSAIRNGDSYLLNLTFRTTIQTTQSLAEIFSIASAPYKLLFKNEFVVFSPEPFVRISNNTISTFPMKGTIDALVDRAAERLLSNEKETWEHNTIVDLMRNDLAMVAKDIRISKYRYIEKIKSHRGELLQTSSEITGTLDKNWRRQLGNNLISLLPAGSISGAPKQKTVEIITQTEAGPRGYYTGVFGIFDGHQLDSAVAIRFIEQDDNRMYYRSGAGITANSELAAEYKETLQKIYVPTV